ARRGRRGPAGRGERHGGPVPGGDGAGGEGERLPVLSGRRLEQAFPEEVHGGVVAIRLARHAGSVPHARRYGQGTGAPAAPGLSSNPYRCTDARGQPGGEGSFDVRIASPPRRGG